MARIKAVVLEWKWKCLLLWAMKRENAKIDWIWNIQPWEVPSSGVGRRWAQKCGNVDHVSRGDEKNVAYAVHPGHPWFCRVGTFLDLSF